MTKRTKRISKALDSALVRACESYGPESIKGAGAWLTTPLRRPARKKTPTRWNGPRRRLWAFLSPPRIRPRV